MQKKESIKIGNKCIGEGCSCFVIAEAGANFRISEDPEKNFGHALKLIDIAVEANADAVKFQIYRAERMYTKTKSGSIEYLGKKEKIYDTISNLEVPYEWLPKLKDYCDKKGIIFLATPFDEESADELEKVGMPAFKIASYTITHLPLIEHISKKGKPLIFSTGGSNIDEIKDAIKTAYDAGNEDIVIMQCTASYPASIDVLNLRAIHTLKKEFGVPIGLSDHSREPIIAPLGAVALGASCYEVHYTTDNELEGPDHAFAILPEELKEVVKKIREMERALGTGKKEMLEQEKVTAHFCRRSIYAKKNIQKGEELTTENIHIVRHGEDKGGLAPKFFKEILGKKSKTDIAVDTALSEEMVE